MPEKAISKNAAYQIINDELMLNGNPRLNLAPFVTTWMEPECDKLMMTAINKNYVDMDEYPVTTELQCALDRACSRTTTMESSPTKENIVVDDCDIDVCEEQDYSDKGKKNDKNVDDCVEPCVGMKFATNDEFQDFYNNYARNAGFGVKIRGSWKMENCKSRVVLACVREDKCCSDQNNVPSFTSCIGCKAQIAVTLNEDGF